MEEVKPETEDWRPLALPGAILLASIILAGAMLYSANNITTQIYSLQAAMRAVPTTGGNVIVAAPTPTPVPNTGNTGGTTTIDVTGKPFTGPADAPVTIVGFTDFQCPFCSRAATTVKQLMSEYPGKIKIVMLNYPLGFHENAQKAAEAYLCAADQGKGYEMHDKMFANQDALAVADLKGYAVDLGLDAQRFNTCLDSGEKAAMVSTETALGTQNEVEGTPTFFINGKKVVGAQPIEVFRQAVNDALAGQ